jgi:hypothetical protein
MSAALAELSRDDALFFCARVNAVVSGFGPEFSRLDRQRRALTLLHVPEVVAAINRFAARNPTNKHWAVFFRGQPLELARWIAAFPCGGDRCLKMVRACLVRTKVPSCLAESGRPESILWPNLLGSPE